MEDVKNKITFSGMGPSRNFSKLIARHIEKWIKRRQTFVFLSNQTRYCVHVDKEAERYFTCHIEILIGDREWSGIEEGRSVIESVLSTLKRLKPKNSIGLYRPASLFTPLHEASI